MTHKEFSPEMAATVREEAAEAVVAVANANMANAVRLLSISRGYDPRDFALVAFGLDFLSHLDVQRSN